MSAPIKPFDFDTLYADDVASFSDASSDASSNAVRAQRFQDLKGDDLYAPADVSETSIGPVPMRRVRTLTNSPSCTPADLSQSDANANSETTNETSRPARRWPHSELHGLDGVGTVRMPLLLDPSPPLHLVGVVWRREYQ